jgi:catechol 2,3-dioxygenase-like lactoylglutathione lyase family enzyme
MPKRTDAHLVELAVASEPAAWERVGFAVRDGAIALGSTLVRPEGEGDELLRWTVAGLAYTDLDGLPTTFVDAVPRAAAVPEHLNGATAIDHVVARTPSLDRTVAALEAAGLELRRVRDAGGGVRQGFLWVGDTILEVVEGPGADPEAPAALWGLVVVVADIDRAAAVAGDALGEPREAVQPGRRIATVRRDAGLGVPVALMTPHVRRAAS